MFFAVSEKQPGERGRRAPYAGLISVSRSVIANAHIRADGNVKQIYEIRNVAYCRMWHIAAPAGDMPSIAMLYFEISE
jgi:hypothetical protein